MPPLRIIKVQRPTNEDPVPCLLLLYEEGHKNMTTVECASDQGKWLLEQLGEEFVAYFLVAENDWVKIKPRSW